MEKLIRFICTAVSAAVLSAFLTVNLSAEEAEVRNVISDLKGDINLDKKVTGADLFAFRYYMHGQLLLPDLTNADMDDSGEINILDYVLMTNAVLEAEEKI